MKKIAIITLILIVTLAIGVLGILTAMKLTTEKSVTPNAPEVKPRAEGISPTLPPACTLTFTLNPTSSPTPGPSATPTITPNPSATVTPTVQANVPPKCTSLSASPTSGDAPLVVNFVGSGFDDNNGYVAGFEFTFGDGQTKKIEQTFHTTDSYTISHSYAQTGSYIATVRVKDNNGDWSDIPDSCKQTITVTGSGPSVTPGPSTPPPIGGQTPLVPTPTTAAAIPNVPVAGNAIPAILTISGGLLLFTVGWLVL